MSHPHPQPETAENQIAHFPKDAFTKELKANLGGHSAAEAGALRNVAVAQAAKGGGRVTMPVGVQEPCRCDTEESPVLEEPRLSEASVHGVVQLC